jgi:predicted N-formylglutamate amidohydrolase
MNALPEKLLAADEPAPVSVHNANGQSPFLLVADHAGNLIPRVLSRLGVAEAELRRHIAWDIGIAGLGRLLADALDATLIQQNYSRLVIDCNRSLEVASSIPDISEHTPILGNAGVSEADRAVRAVEIFWPYHNRIEAELDRRRQAGRATAHNAPYTVNDATDYTVPAHAERRGLHHVLIEIRQDLIADEDGQRQWALRLARLLPLAYRQLLE